MDRIRKSIELIRSQMAQMKPIHKVLVGSSVVIMLLALLLVTQYAGRSNDVAISVPLEIRDAVNTEMAARGIRYKLAGDDYLVPASQQREALGILTQNLGGADGATVLLDLIKSQPWYANRHQNQQQYNAALSQVLADVITRWTFVKRADVFLTPANERSSAIGTPRNKATASVAIVPATADLSPDQVSGIAQFLAGTVSDLAPEDVTVLNAQTGQPMRARSDKDISSSTYMELQQTIDAYWREKIEENLRNIPGVIVSVNAQVDAAPVSVNDLTYKKEGDGTVNPVVSETEDKSNSSEPSLGGAPGVQPNTGQGITNGASNSSGNTTNSTKTEFSPYAGKKETVRTDTKGYARKINATVKMPLSYYTRIWKVRNPDATDQPDAAALQAIETEEIAKVRDEVLALIDTEAITAASGDTPATPGTVVVNTYTDLGPMLAPENAGTQTGALGMPSTLVNLPWKSGGLVFLAVLSLFMMVRLSRSTTKRGDLPTAAELVGIPPNLSSANEELVGQADESDTAIDAVEINNEDLRARSILDQISEMVTQDSTEARRLLSRWISSPH